MEKMDCAPYDVQQQDGDVMEVPEGSVEEGHNIHVVLRTRFVRYRVRRTPTCPPYTDVYGRTLSVGFIQKLETRNGNGDGNYRNHVIPGRPTLPAGFVRNVTKL